MGLTITTLQDITVAQVAAAQADLSQVIGEQYPAVDLGGGVLHDLLLHLSAAATAVNRAEIQRVLDAQSLLAIQTNPALADPAIADQVFSNYEITRNLGTTAAGEITIVVTDPVPVVIASGTIFSVNSVEFVTDAPFTARAPGTTLQSDNDRLLQPLGGNNYTFSISVTAVLPGSAGNVSRNSRFTSDNTIDRLVMAYAAADFTGGSDVETNAAILQRMELGIAAKCWSNRPNIISLLKAQPEFLQTIGYAIIGCGNPEMVRDKHGIFPVATGGKTDVYARTGSLPVSTLLQLEATLVSVGQTTSVWQLAIERDTAPGFYEVEQILPLTADPGSDSGYTILSDVRGYDLSGTEWAPDIVNVEEAAYTRYQTALIRFTDTDTAVSGLTVGATKNYNVVFSIADLIAPLQIFCAGSDVRNTAGDALIRAAVPCFLSVSCTIEQGAEVAVPDSNGIKNAIAAAVNNLNFPGQLYASTISDAIAPFLSNRQAVSNVQMQARIRRPDGQNLYLRDAAVLRMPNQPNRATTGRTIAIYLDPDNISVNVVVKGFDLSA